MGVFSRMSNMIKAKVNNTLDEVENPIELLDQKLRDMTEQLSKAKLNSAQVIGNSHSLEKQMINAQREAADYEAKVKLALSKGNEDLAKRALAKKVAADNQYNTLKSSYEGARAQADTLKKNLAALEAEIEKTRQYRDQAAARYANAKASEKVNEIMANVQTKSNSIQIDQIERKISRTESRAAGLGELKNCDTFESEFAELDAVDLDLELEKYKN
ncbi:MAG: PspA/IM30 family protein [Clostridium sp.]